MRKNKKTNLPTTDIHEYKKLYQREWRKKPENKQYEHNRYLKNKVKISNYYKISHNEKRQLALSIIGDKCLICNTIKRLQFHEIHGKKHNEHCHINYYLKQPENFITLCYYHHKLIHLLVNLTPEQLKECLRIASNLPFYVDKPL